MIKSVILCKPKCLFHITNEILCVRNKLKFSLVTLFFQTFHLLTVSVMLKLQSRTDIKNTNQTECKDMGSQFNMA